MKRTILSFALIITTIVSARCQLKITNTTSQPINVAVAYQNKTGDFNGYYSVGWYNILPGETKETLSGILISRNYYYYAETEDMSLAWEGNGEYTFLVDPTNGFNIKNANQQYVQDQTPSYAWEKFRMLDVGHSITFTLTL